MRSGDVEMAEIAKEWIGRMEGRKCGKVDKEDGGGGKEGRNIGEGVRAEEWIRENEDKSKTGEEADNEDSKKRE